MSAQRETGPAADIILSMEHITKTYQGVVALDDVSLSIRRGEVHALVGENGAGKSTLLKILSGFTEPDCGRFAFDGKTFSQITPHRAKEAGIEIIYQELNLMPDVSVAENVFMGKRLGNGPFIDRPGMEKRTAEIFDQLGIPMDPKARVEQLSTAQMQFVAIAKAMAGEAKLLVMDEPTAPLTTQDAQILFKLIARLKAQGVTIIYISHRLTEVYALSDRLTVLRDGKIVTTAHTGALGREELIQQMVGRKLSEAYPSRTAAPGDALLRVEGLCGNGVRDVSFTLRKGEILGFAGLSGSGRTEMVRLLFGADKKTSGRMELGGRSVEISSPQRAVALGFGFVPEDRKGQGVLSELSIRENIALPILKRISRCFLLSRKRENAVIETYREALHIKTPTVQQLVRNLSGGNQQKVVISKWLASNPQILIFDEPTQGIDVGAKYEIYQIMNKLTEQGLSIIMISSEMEELMGMADRIIVLHEGRTAGVLKERRSYTQEEIMRLASGGGGEGMAACF